MTRPGSGCLAAQLTLAFPEVSLRAVDPGPDLGAGEGGLALRALLLLGFAADVRGDELVDPGAEVPLGLDERIPVARPAHDLVAELGGLVVLVVDADPIPVHADHCDPGTLLSSSPSTASWR